jgi:SAM-dependent methyltransferase
MQPKPDFYSRQYASAFQEISVADAYRHRPEYPQEAIDTLVGLVVDAPRAVLDAGCGTGFLARRLAGRVDRVDAVDVSAPMIEWGRKLPGGDHPHLTWIVGTAEDAPLRPPYALITTGDSLHWMDWYVVMPRFARLLTPNGHLAILGVETAPPPWEEELWSLIRRYSTIPRWQAFNLVAGLEERGLFRRAGARRTEPFRFAQSLDAYVESFHGRASFSRERLTPEDAAAFDETVRAVVEPICGVTVEIQVYAEVVWGKPGQP